MFFKLEVFFAHVVVKFPLRVSVIYGAKSNFAFVRPSSTLSRLEMSMKYVSTRGDQTKRSFCEILLEGLAHDGGLYMPKKYPVVEQPRLTYLRSLYANGAPGGYADLAFEILSMFIDDIPAADLKALVGKTYTKQMFDTDAIVPVRKLGDSGLLIEALSNGPTLAFKDVALQLLGNLFEYELARRGEELNILGATSGDTGSAAEYAMRGKQGVRVFMLSPHGRMSPFQQAQMYSLQDANIHNIAVEGVFDDAQDIVKAVSNDLAFKRQYKIGTVNSINWARILAQVVYYFAGYFQATKSNQEQVSFAVPSGNFGNVCAGHVARMMGLPIKHLVVATNENDVLDEFFRTGTYRVRKGSETHETSSPSMDISKASNFERFIFDLVGRDGARCKALFTELGQKGSFTLSSDLRRYLPFFRIQSGKSTHSGRLKTIALVFDDFSDMIDPHTADAMKVAIELQEPGVPMIVMETALPAKFQDTIREALGPDVPVERPAVLEGIENLPKRFTVMKPDTSLVKDFIKVHCASD